MNPLPPKLRDWLTETFNRLFEKRPQYFKYWSWLSYALMLISGVPYILTWIGVDLPEPFSTLSNKFFTGVGVAMLVMSQLPVKSPPVGQTEEGSAVIVTNEKVMPFTSKSEKESVEEQVPPPPVLPDVPETPPTPPEELKP